MEKHLVETHNRAQSPSQDRTVVGGPKPQKALDLNIADLVVAEIAIDAATNAKAYLEQTIVPEGGE